MQHTVVIVTKDWTDPGTGRQIKAGTAVAVPSWYISADESVGLAGGYRWPAPWESVNEGDTGLPDKAPPAPNDPPSTKPATPSRMTKPDMPGDGA